MKAAPGDRIIIESRHLGDPVRDGEILEAHGADGGPPYLVRWSDDGRVALLSPGPDAHVSGSGAPGPVPDTPVTMHVRRWQVTVFLTEEDGHTSARAVLDAGAQVVTGVGEAQRGPDDDEVPEIGDELAAGRALIDLGRRLVSVTEADIEALEGHPVHVRS